MKILKFLFPVIAVMFFTHQTTLATSCPGVTTTSHPYGLSYAAFNCYTDNYWLQDNFGGGQREQDFIRVRKNNVGDFSNSVTLNSAGDTALVLIFAHNSGEEDKYPARNGKITLDWSNLPNVKGTISASNTNPISVDDNVSINVGSNVILQPLALYYKGTKIKDLDPNSTKKDITFTTFGSSYKNSKYFFVSFVAIKKELPKLPKISVAKVDANNLDQDGVNGSTKGNIQFNKANKSVFTAEDSQTIIKGQTSKFKIIVKNDGEAPLKNIVLTDANAPACNRTAAQTAGLYSGSTLAPGATFSYFCEKSNIQANYVNAIQISAVGAGTDTRTVYAGDRTEILVTESTEEPKISVAKVDANGSDQDNTNGSTQTNIEFDNSNKTQFTPNDSQLITQGDISRFRIIVKNTGDVGLTDIVLVDQLEGSCNKNESQTRGLVRKRGNKNVILDPGESFTYLCQKSNTQSEYINSIKVSAKGGNKIVRSQDRSEVKIQTNNGFCGDGIVDNGEACDDGNNSNNDLCTNTCQLTTCGDGIIQNPNGSGQAEQCDDGNQNGANKGKCSTACTIVGGGGGGGASVVSSIGTCAIAPGPSAGWQCQGRKPYRNGEGWLDYVNCKTGNGGFDITGIIGLTREQKCVTAWAQYMNLNTCGNAGDSASNNPASCNPLPPFEGGGIIPNSSCPGCFKASSFITKSANKEKIARGDEVEYNLKLKLAVSDLIHYKVISAKVRFYDFTIPAYEGNLWGRNGLSAGWTESPSGGKYFERYFGSGHNVIADINTHGGAVINLNYKMNSSLASTSDTASIDNVAFAVVDYTYRNIGCNASTPACGHIQSQKVLLAGRGQSTARALNIWKHQQQNASYSSLGDMARIDIVRPFVRSSNGGNLGFEFSHTRTDKVTATDENILGSFTTGEIFVDGNGTDSTLFDFNGYETIDNIDPLKQFQTSDINKYYDNLKLNAITVTDSDFGVDFKKPMTQEVYFLETGTLILDGEIDLGGKNKTFIIERGNLVIGSAGVKLKNGFAAFIVRGTNKSILINKNTTRMEGLFIAEKGEIKSQNNDVSRKQLQVFGALMGNIEPLLNKRWYIGTNPGMHLEPNIEIEFDLRLLENTPPTLEQFLGNNWQEDVQ